LLSHFPRRRDVLRNQPFDLLAQVLVRVRHARPNRTFTLRRSTTGLNGYRKAPRLLVVGYGFSDYHVNAALEKMTRIHGDAKRTCVIDYIDMVMETGSTRRANLSVMLQRWGRTQFAFRDSNPDPWTSADGCARLYWKGFLNTPASDVVAYLAG
jgi:hypothetical protein